MKTHHAHIGYDASYAFTQNSGTTIYSKEIMIHLSRLDHINRYTIFPFFIYHFIPHYMDKVPKLAPNFQLFLENLPFIIRKFLWQDFKLLRQLYTPKFDLFHSNTFVVPPSYMYKKLIMTIYDVSFYTHPHCHLHENIQHCLKGTLEAVQRADKIIAISQNTKNDLIKYFDCPPNKIAVTYLACNPAFYLIVSQKTIKSVLNKYRITEPYIFHLGSLEPRKNTLGLVKAFELLPKQIASRYRLVIAGAEGWLNNDIINYLQTSKYKDRINLLGYIPDSHLPALFQGAEAFAYPSLYEGFGIPVLESLASGCPVLISNNSSLPEVGGDAAIYCNPKDILDIKKKLIVITNLNRSLLSQKSKIQAAKFSWEITAKQTLAVYKEVLNENDE